MLIIRIFVAVFLCLCPLVSSFMQIPGFAAKPCKKQSLLFLDSIRGGEQTPSSKSISGELNDATEESVDPPPPQNKAQSTILSITAALAPIGRFYYCQLGERPILTKSVTAGFVFGLSDYLAQKIENSESETAKINPTRVLTSTLIGLLYFGPAAHFWYEIIFRLIPGTGILSTIYKAFWGQVIFGPSFTCIFFAANLLQSGNFTIKGWFQKIRNDLPEAWVAGVGFWPLVDLVSYSIVPIVWIPLFINVCSLVWTIYLSLVANRK